MSAIKPPARIVPMRVIICGVHRTGTFSMRQALYTLGLHDVYHMHALISDPSRASLWTRAIEAKYLPDSAPNKPVFTKEDWDQLLGDCQGVCDIPPAFFGADLAEIYPDAKVVIMNRDAEKWYDSVLGTTYKMTQPKGWGRKLKMLFCMLLDRRFWELARFVRTMNKLAMGGYDHGLEKDKALDWFDRQYAEFRERIPEERRIEYRITDGWAPLCKHLGVDVPMVKDEKTGEVKEVPFPRLNDRLFFEQRGDMLVDVSVKKALGNLINGVGRLGLAAVVGYGVLTFVKTGGLGKWSAGL